MSKIELLIEILEKRKSGITIWSEYHDGVINGIQEAIDILKASDEIVTSPLEMEVTHA